MRDPHYRKILEGLAGPLDPQLFEGCAVDLLRDTYPGLVPIRGGQDAGMDGAISDGEGEPFPLVVTTSEDVLRNLTDSLDSYLNNGGRRRRVVVATSTRLTPPFQRKVRDLARDKGFVLVNLHEKSDLADRLYRNSQWTKDLLGLSGQPSALSALPPESRRPLLEIELRGRDADLRWLRETSGDRVIVGQPGSGKTYLLLQLVREDGALFLASDDPTAIANAARDLKPSVVLVDDAHVDPERLDRLRHLRQEIDPDFAIVANTWPGAVDEVADALGIGNEREKIRRLELLTRKEILQVLRDVGVMEPDDDPYLRLVVDQSANKPGLAVLLGSLWLRGEGRDVLTGKAIQNYLGPTLERILGHDPTRLLACFALGGDAGVPMDVVREFLTLSREEIHRRATLASQGGVLAVRGNGDLVVEPEVLRFAVIEEIFFNAHRLPTLAYRLLFDALPNKKQAVETLVLAAHRGVQIPRGELQDLVSSDGTPDAWRGFARLGRAEAEWVLREYPGQFIEIAYAILAVLPRVGVDRLLDAARGAQGPLHAQWLHPLRLLQDWLRAIPDDRDWVDAAIKRRELVIEVAKSRLAESPLRPETLRACFLALSPVLEDSRDKATRDGMVIRKAMLPAAAGSRMLELWSDVRNELGEWTAVVWSELENALHAWAFPDLPKQGPDDREIYRNVARQMVQDLAETAQGTPGLCLALEAWAVRLELSVKLEVDLAFRALNPPDALGEAEDRKAQREADRRRARTLASQWAGEPPDEVGQRIAFFEEQSRVFLGNRHGWHIRTELHQALAASADSPSTWIDAFIQHGVGASWLNPLLSRTIRESNQARECLVRCLRTDEYSWLAAQLAIWEAKAPNDILSDVLATAPPEVLESACLRGDLPLGRLRRLLRHRDERVAAAAVVGEWSTPPHGVVRGEIQPEWRKTVLRIGETTGEDELHVPMLGYWLKEILSRNPGLANSWLMARLEDGHPHDLIERDGIYAAAVRALSEPDRIEIVKNLRDEYRTRYLAALLVGQSANIYRHLLVHSGLRRHHLCPLQGHPPDEPWIALARLAVEAGHGPAEIAEASFHPVFLTTVSLGDPDRWNPWRDGYQAMTQLDEAALREIGLAGLAQVDQLITEAQNRRRNMELFGAF